MLMNPFVSQRAIIKGIGSSAMKPFVYSVYQLDLHTNGCGLARLGRYRNKRIQQKQNNNNEKQKLLVKYHILHLYIFR